MHRWGITFIGIGALSFLLPLFGRQFILVSLLGFTGMGSAMAGLILLAVGIYLFTEAQKKERQEFHDLHPMQQLQVPQVELNNEFLSKKISDGNVITQREFDAAEAGDVDVQVLVGSAYLSGTNGLPNNVEQAFHYLRSAALQGHGYACFAIAGMYADGLGVPKNFDYARLWAVKAKEKGVVNADEMLVAIDVKCRV